MSVRLVGASSQYLTRANPPDYNAAYTYAGWWYFTTITSTFNFLWHWFVDSSNNDQGQINFPTTTKVIYRVRDVAANFDITGTSGLAAGGWFYLAFVRADGTNTELFLGTTAGNIASYGTTAHILSARATPLTLQIGASQTIGNVTDGRLRSHRIWTAALTVAELRAEAASLDSAVRTANIWAAWPLAVGGTLTDNSGNGRDLTAVNGPLTTESDPGGFASYGSPLVVSNSWVRSPALRQDWVEPGNTRVEGT